MLDRDGGCKADIYIRDVVSGVIKLTVDLCVIHENGRVVEEVIDCGSSDSYDLVAGNLFEVGDDEGASQRGSGADGKLSMGVVSYRTSWDAARHSDAKRIGVEGVEE